MALDRALQLKILQRYAEVYPLGTHEKWPDLGDDEMTVAANLHYL